MERLGRWAAETRAGRALSLTGIVVIVLGGAYLVIREEVGRQTHSTVHSIVQRIQVIEEAKPTEVIRACLRMPKCRHLLRAGAQGTATPEERHASERGGGAFQSPHSGGQQPKPGHKPGGPAKGGGEHAAQEAPAPSAPEDPAPSPPSASTAPEPEPPAPPAPGSSGDTPGAKAGAQVCVELAVSACVEAGLPELP